MQYSLALTGLSFRRWRRGWRKRRKSYPVIFTTKGWQPQSRYGWCGDAVTSGCVVYGGGA